MITIPIKDKETEAQTNQVLSIFGDSTCINRIQTQLSNSSFFALNNYNQSKIFSEVLVLITRS